MQDFGLDINGKVAVVTGAGGVLCSMFAKTLAEQGLRLLFLILMRRQQRRLLRS